MIYTLLADALVLLHFAFIVFVIAGGLLLFKWPALVWIHLPAAVWGAVVEFQGWICPLTPLEVQLRKLAGERSYSGDFIDNYVLALMYPGGLTEQIQIVLGLIVVLLNALIYTAVWRRRVKRNAT
jgi:hypothetical protein